MKSVLSRLMIAIIVLIVAYFGYSRRFQIAAKVWHWRHGYFTRVGDYVIPVPEYWLVQEVIPQKTTDLVDTSGRGKPKGDPAWGVSVISVSSLPTGTRDLDSWKTYRKQWLERHGVRDIFIEERTIHFEGTTVVCVGNRGLRDPVVRLPTQFVSLDCTSNDTLGVTFVGQVSRLDEFDAFVSQIRKQK